MRFWTVLSLCAMSLAGQSQLANVSGSVADATAAMIPGASLKLTNQETGETWSTSSDEQGNFVLPLIKPGKYQFDVEKTGFKPYRQTEIVLETSGQHRLDIKLEIGSQSERVVVEAALPQMQTESAVVGTVVDNRTIADMPLINRRAAQLARLTGFVVQVGTGSNFSMGGGRGNNTNWRIDGANVQNVMVGDQGLNFDPPIESLQEFSVSVSNYSAELGRTGGGVVQMTTKSGTNQFHGSAYEYFRNQVLDARTFFSANKAPLRYNLFGASLGGPIRKDRTFFFFNYEGRRQTNATTVIQNVPGMAERTGDYSASSIAIRDPEAAGRAPFPGNRIPANRLDPIGARLAAVYPAPNVPGQPSGNANFRANAVTQDNPNNFVTRLDHNFNERDRLYGRFLSSTSDTQDRATWPTEAMDPNRRIRTGKYYNGSGTWFHNFRPNLINEFRFNYDWRRFVNLTGGSYTNFNREIGLAGVRDDFAPRVTLTGYQTMGEGSNHERIQSPIKGMQFTEQLLWLKSNHSIKLGFERRSSRNDDLNRNTAGGLFGFNNVASGDAVASLLLGWVQSASVNEVLPIRSEIVNYSGFVQDDWKIHPKLMLNLGLRWEMDTPRRELFDNRMNSFDLTAINPVSGTPGVVTFAGRNGVSQWAHNFDPNNFAPRLGFAWRATEKWVVRGGGAVVYMGLYDQATVINATNGFAFRGNFVSPDNGLTPPFRLRSGMPPVAAPTEADLTPGFGAVPLGASPQNTIEFFQPGPRATTYLLTTHFSVQRQLPGQMVLEAGYLATGGRKLASPASLTLNQVRPELMGPGNAQARRPFPQFTDVQLISQPFGNSNYHAGNLKLDKRYSRGLHFQMNYTFAKGIDDVESRAELGGGAGNAGANAYNRRADRGLSGNSIKHRWIGNVVYELPFGKGRSHAIGNSVANAVLGGWTIGYIGEIRSGAPYGVIEQTNLTNSFSPQNRPNVVGSPVLSGDRSRAELVSRYFDTAAFAAPAQFTFGNAGRINGYGPGAVSMDVSILKDFRLAERHTLQFRSEMLNFPNIPNFGLPNLNRGNATFGRITTLVDGNQSRIVQFGLHYKF